MRTILIGNPSNRRVVEYRRCLTNRGFPDAEVISYRELCVDPETLLELDSSAAIVRQDSAGEEFEVGRALLELGWPAAQNLGCSSIDPRQIAALEFDLGLILCPRQQHLGFLALQEKMQKIFDARPLWNILQPSRGIEFLFDKRSTSARWRDANIRVPDSIEATSSLDELLEALRSKGTSEVYIKVSCSSSASCLAILQLGQNDKMRLTTTIECTESGWYNSLRLRRYSEREQVAEIVNYLLGEGAQVEQSVRKARLAGSPFDIRFVVIDGEALFGLVRQSRHPITNLHLGGWRGEWSALKKAVAPAVLTRARRDAEAAAKLSECFVVGVDVLITANRQDHRVIEGNAFGDLLPGLTSDDPRFAGQTVYEAIATAASGRLLG